MMMMTTTMTTIMKTTMTMVVVPVSEVVRDRHLEALHVEEATKQIS